VQKWSGGALDRRTFPGFSRPERVKKVGVIAATPSCHEIVSPGF